MLSPQPPEPRKGEPCLTGAAGLALHGKRAGQELVPSSQAGQPTTQRVSAEITSLPACAPGVSPPRRPVSGPTPRPGLDTTCMGPSDQAWD